jgi:hypothetical protein
MVKVKDWAPSQSAAVRVVMRFDHQSVRADGQKRLSQAAGQAAVARRVSGRR